MTPKSFIALSAAIFLALLAPGRAAYLPKGSAAAGGARNICLIYNSSFVDGVDYHRNWQQDDFIPILTFETTSGSMLAPMFDSLLLLGLKAQSGRGFTAGFGTGPSTAADWAWYRDGRLFGGDDHLRKADDAAARVGTAFGAPGYRVKVFLMIPYPDSTQHDFGPIDSSGRSLDFANLGDRLDAVKWYISSVRALWKAAGFHNLDLVGFYWLEETVHTVDQALLPRVSGTLHSTSHKFLWIPYYRATGYSAWRDWGFDAAIYQPNYFFTATIPYSRLDDAAAGAQTYGMGVELEFDDRVISDASYRDRYENYLKAGRLNGFQSGALTAWYMGGDSLIKCARSTDPAVHAIYYDTYDFIADVPVPGDADKNRLVDVRDVLATLQVVGGLKAGAPTDFAPSSADVLPDAILNLRDATKILRFINGLQATLP